MKKIVLKLNLHDDEHKQKAMKKVSGVLGVESISIDMKDQKMTVIGDVDPVDVVKKLKGIYHPTIDSVGPAKEPEKKKEEPKKPEPKKEEPKKPDELAIQLANLYRAHHPHLTTHYFVRSVEEDPNACVIC